MLTNPPFGTKKGGERATRDDFTYQTSNKQLNFLQHIYRSLNADGHARAAVVLPDNVLFAEGDGTAIRRDLMEKCDLHTILRLNMPSFGKTHPLTEADFAAFEAAYTAADRAAVEDERWHVYTREAIAAKGDTLDLGLIRDDSIQSYEELPDPKDSAEEAIGLLEEAVRLLRDVADELAAARGRCPLVIGRNALAQSSCLFYGRHSLDQDGRNQRHLYL